MLTVHLAVLVIGLLISSALVSSAFASSDVFTENLHIRPLSTGHVYAHFEFKTLYNKKLISLNYENHFDLFPAEIARLITDKRVQELQFSLTKNGWKTKQWGRPFRDASPGFEINVWFGESTLRPDKNFKEITNYLSGKFCASISSVDRTASVSPRHLLQPSLFGQKAAQRRTNLTNHPTTNFYASLPHETVCTENLTPWKKLLPCHSKAGLSSLLNSVFIMNSNYFSISVDLEPFCLDDSCAEKGIALKQSVSIVFNPLLKNLNKQSWSLIKLFGLSIRQPCWLASESRILIDISDNRTDNANVLSPPYGETVERDELFERRRYAVYDVNEFFRTNPNASKFNVASIYSNEHRQTDTAASPVYANRFFVDNAFFAGKIKCKITNNQERPLTVTYLEVLPWQVRVYLHTLKIESERIGEPAAERLNIPIEQSLLHYEPGHYKTRPYHLELRLQLPARSVITVLFDVDKVFLKWTEYPPDANHGIYIGSAIIESSTESSMESSTDRFRIATEPLLIALPTPDFSMPYNVICLVSTVISLAFAPIHNFSTRFVSVINEKKK